MNQTLQVVRPNTESDYAVLKQSSKRLIKACGGLEAASLVTRVGHSELARYYDPEEKLYMPIDVAADLEATSGGLIVTKSLALMLGFALVPVQSQGELEPVQNWTALLAHLGAETAATLRQIGSALAEHGTLTAEGINHFQLTRHLENLVQAATLLKAAISQRQERGETARLNQRRAVNGAPVHIKD